MNVTGRLRNVQVIPYDEGTNKDGPAGALTPVIPALPPITPEVHRMLPHPRPPRIDGAF